MQIKTIISFFTASQNCQKHPNSKHGHSRYIPLLVHDAPYLAGPTLHILAIWIRTGKKFLSAALFIFFHLSQEIFCKLMSFTQSTFVFFSSVSVALIAVDRMLVIVYPDVKQISNKQVKSFGFK